MLRYVGEWERTVRTDGPLGRFQERYITMDLNYMESILWVFRTLWDKGLIYEGFKILLTAPLRHPPFQFRDQPGVQGGHRSGAHRPLPAGRQAGYGDPAWTTTPWTLPSNMALAVGKDIIYVEVADGEMHYILAKDRLAAYYRSATEYTILREFPGSELARQAYRPLFPYFSDKKAEGASGW